MIITVTRSVPGREGLPPLTKRQARARRRIRRPKHLEVNGILLIPAPAYRVGRWKSAVLRLEREMAAVAAAQPRGRRPKWMVLRLKRLAERLERARARLVEHQVARGEDFAARRRLAMRRQTVTPQSPSLRPGVDWMAD